MKLFFEKKKLIYSLYLLIFFSFHSFSYSDGEVQMNYAELGKYGSSTIQFGYNLYYLDLKDFQNEDYLYFKVTLEFGFFTSIITFFIFTSRTI